MARTPRSEVFDPEEVTVAHVVQRCVRGCFLLGDDPESARNFNHRKSWLEEKLQHFAACFGIDLLGFAILSNHFHQVLRSRPDIVAAWDDTEVARRWLRICPLKKDPQGRAQEPTESDLDTIRRNPVRLAEIRRRLSSFSWWMRLLCQPLAAMANKEEDQQGRFWQGRFRATRLCDEASILACAAYVDLNVIRAALAETIETSDFTSIQRRIQSLQVPQSARSMSGPDRFLAPILIDEAKDAIGAVLSVSPYRASDKGFLPMSTVEYIQLLDWTARQVVKGKSGATPAETPEVLQRLGLSPRQWSGLVQDFGRLFSLVAGLPATVADQSTRLTHRRFHLRQRFHALFAAQAA